MTEMPDDWSFSRGRQELYCPHGTGHPVPWSNKSIHGCDGCCSGSPGDETNEWEQAVQALREKRSAEEL